MPQSYEFESGDLQYIQEFSSDQVIDWLIKGFSDEDFDGIYHWWKRDFVDANFISSLWKNSSPDVQKLVTDSVATSLADWNFEENEDVLMDFVYLAAYIREERVVPSLIGMIDNNLVYDHEEDNGELDTKSSVISVPAGFAPSPKIKEAFERWLYDPGFDQKHAGQLVVGLVTCQPNESARYLERFFEIEREMPADTFRLDYLFAIIDDTLGSQQLRNVMKKLPDYMRERIEIQLSENEKKQR